MRALRVSPTTREALVAIGLTVAVEVEVVTSTHESTPARAATALLVTLPLVLRLRYPLATLTLVLAGLVTGAALGARTVTGPIFPVVAVLLALYALGSRGSGRRVAIGGALTVIALFAASQLEHSDVGNSLALAVLVTTAGLVVGAALGTLRYEFDTFSERASQLERERDERARLAVADERRRIARELHDVIGHSISVMGVQAGAVRSVLRSDQARERDALLAVERTGRQAVGEMRRLIGLLRTEDEAAGAPTPSLRRVEELAAEMRAAGLRVGIEVQGDLSLLSPGVDLAGYRIVQEALTNALKHAPGAAVDATVTCSATGLAIEVVDEGRSPVDPASDHVGHGLLGMRERIALYGGELEAGPNGSRGFAVRARIPVEGA